MLRPARRAASEVCFPCSKARRRGSAALAHDLNSFERRTDECGKLDQHATVRPRAMNGARGFFNATGDLPNKMHLRTEASTDAPGLHFPPDSRIFCINYGGGGLEISAVCVGQRAGGSAPSVQRQRRRVSVEHLYSAGAIGGFCGYLWGSFQQSDG